MNELEFIESVVHRTARRRRWQRAFRGLWEGLFLGGVLWLGAFGLYKLLPLPVVVLGWALAGLGLCALGGALLAFRHAPSSEATARWLDQRLQLKERLSTALELAHAASPTDWRRMVLHDAAGHAKQLDPRQLLPLTLPPASRRALLVLALGAGLGFVPEYRTAAHRQKQADAAVIRETGQNLAELTRHTLEVRKPALLATEQALERVKDLGDRLLQAKLTRSEALRELVSVMDKLKDVTRHLAKDPALRRLEQAARTPVGANPTSAADLQQKMEALQKSLGDNAPDPAALDKLQRDLQKLQQAAAAMQPGDAAASQALKQQLEKSLADLARQAAELGLSLPPLDEAIQALEASQIDQFLKDLDLARMDLEKLAKMAQALQQLQMHLAQLGKDLAEQLDKGQAFAAQATLKQMMNQLQQANLSQEQLRSILQEVDKAVQPGSEYGQVGEFLKDAVRQMQQGNQPAAGQSLAKAADELQRLMDQLGDCQSLLATLANLERASACVGTGQGWGQCAAGGFTLNPREGGSRPGTAAAPLDILPQDALLNEELKPTKVKGQITPGAPMPSITLKGVSIKGASRVQYEEAVTAAQTDAQSALSQEKVPRAYQGIVRDYFDELKR